MIALTQENREELIGVIEKALPVMRNEASLPYSNRELSKHVEVYELALASLTAECKYFQWKWARDENAAWTTTPIETLSDAVSAFGKNGENVIYRMLFTAPPVPEIKLPEDTPDLINLSIDEQTEFNRGFWFAVEKIKRLNGWDCDER